MTKHQYNRKYFSNGINSNEKAYWLGYILGDAFISYYPKDNMYIIGFHCQKKDKTILKNFLNCIEGEEGQIKDCVEKRENFNGKTFISESSRLRIYSKDMYYDLKGIGIPTKNKSKNCTIPKFPLKYNSHFVRGLIDSDGTISRSSNKRPGVRFSIYGTQSVCEGISYIMGRNGKNVIKNRNIFVFTTTISDSQDMLKLYHYLYDDCGDCYLPRKREKFEKIIKERIEYENLMKISKSKPEIILVNE